MVPPRKRKLIQTCPVTTTLSIGNCVVEFPNDVEQDYSPNTLSLQVHKSASIRISVDSSKHQPSGILSHSSPGNSSSELATGLCLLDLAKHRNSLFS